MTAKDLPTLNAALNALSAILLLSGYAQIKRGNRKIHKKIMLSALVVSLLFLASYAVYHAQVGSVPYPHHDWTRPLYFAVLIPHVLFAALMTPFIVIAVRFALKEQHEKHRKFVRWIWPVWIFVSFSGIIIYLMLYHL